ncbi:MAG: ABC transporter ATP-binding protein, partial [Rhodospirillales bacterium]|nr:ABC transporter ATP-binding protein [Rhodospirillales bacterium]
RIVEHSPAASLFGAPLHPYTLGLLHALPRIDRRLGKLPIMRGGVPDPCTLPRGCRYSDRCPEVENMCRTREPVLNGAGAGRWVACLKVAP